MLIGLSAAVFVLFNGRIAGIGGILGGLLEWPKGDIAWRVAFLAGLIGAPLAYGAVLTLPEVRIDADFPTLIIAVKSSTSGKLLASITSKVPFIASPASSSVGPPSLTITRCLSVARK